MSCCQNCNSPRFCVVSDFSNRSKLKKTFNTLTASFYTPANDASPLAGAGANDESFGSSTENSSSAPATSSNSANTAQSGAATPQASPSGSELKLRKRTIEFSSTDDRSRFCRLLRAMMVADLTRVGNVSGFAAHIRRSWLAGIETFVAHVLISLVLQPTAVVRVSLSARLLTLLV